MDKRKNIMIVIRIIIVVAVLFQLSRLDYMLIKNSTSDSEQLNLKYVPSTPLAEKYESDDRFAVYYSKADENSLVLKTFFEQILKDTKKQADFYEVSQISSLDGSAKQIIVLIEDLEKLKDVEGLGQYIDGGGSVLFGQTPQENTAFYSIYRKLGIDEIGPPSIMEGLEIKDELFPGVPGTLLEAKEFLNFSAPVRLDKDCRIFLNAKNGNPLLWQYKSGKGNVVVFNGTILLDKVSVGLIVRSIALLEHQYVYPIINSKVVFLDDYPAPFPKGNDPTISRDFDKSIKDFYIDVWWPDMLQIAKQHGLKYTAVMIQSYNNFTKPPFEDLTGEIENDALKILGKEIFRSGGELGLHGYNHQSLTVDHWRSDELGYNYWKSKDDMKEALSLANDKFKASFPNYKMNVYVPPSNVIDKVGLAAITEALPDTKIIASVFYEDFEHLNYTQNFEVDQNGLIHFPRFSSGYDNSDFNKWSIINGVAGYGVFSHFIHPDDFMDPERNHGKNWAGMLEEYRGIISELSEHYPWLRGQTSTEGANGLLNYLALDYSVDYKKDEIIIKANDVAYPIYMILKSDKKPLTTINCQVDPIDSLNYMVTVDGPLASIKIEGE